MIPITKKEIILAHLEGSPIMTTIRNGTLADLEAFRKDFREQIRMRKAATRESCGTTLLLTICCTSVVFLFFRPTLIQLIGGHIAALLISYGCWAMTIGSRYHRAAMIETVMTTLIDKAITEKQLAALHQEILSKAAQS